MPLETAESLQHVAQAFESSLLICLHSIVENGLQHGGNDKPGSQWDHTVGVLPASKEEALERCIREIDLVPLDGQVEAGFLPLLFVVACETNDLGQSLAAIQRVDRLGTNIGIGNQCYAGVLVREIWAHRLRQDKSSWRDFLKNSDWKDLILT